METIVHDLKPAVLFATVIYALLGTVIFGLAFWLFAKLSPFSVRKEIEEDQNTALSIIIGSVVLGLAIIVASAMH